jgi:nitrile hydratase accessory protein
MQTTFEHFAVSSMMGHSDSPPRINAKLCFAEDWERQAFGVALALSKAGHFDWEDFRQNLITAIGEWENSHSLDDASWSYYERWLTALERVMIEAELVTGDELAKLGGRDSGSSVGRLQTSDDRQPARNDGRSRTTE